MKKLHLLLPLAAVLLASSCKKKDDVSAPESPEVITKSAFRPDSTSFTIDGKRYTNALINPSASRAYGNRGVNLQLSTTPGDWSIGVGNNYWVGDPDSVQYYSSTKTSLEKSGSAVFSFIKKYRRANALKLGNMYLPNTGSEFFTLGDTPYAVDFERGGRDEGVAIELLVNNEKLTTYSQVEIYDKSKLTAESQKTSKFKILKIEEIKGTNFIVLEASFEATVFDKNEHPVKVTDGFFRITTPKNGERSDSFTLLYL